MSDVVERARELLAGITPWPWIQVGFGNIHHDPPGAHPPVAKVWKRANGDFIAAAPQLVSELTAEVKQLRREIRSMRRQIEMFLEDGVRERLIVALGASDLAVPDHELGAEVKKARNIAYHELGIEPTPVGLRALPAAKPNTPTSKD
ncbi:hypothetical protein PBI_MICHELLEMYBELL_56 [Mycobacterium phage MichelleMyBell]|uniref:Uncharacterized protein n=1 Tax=Mycobacterium phage MichelleMyBell TaxID=1445726 RepID=W0LK23_9CAUD|nr:hypothetical protein CH20_gp56 [Mycobacterium phage MichelleMyBell]AHG24377.1 hypothetical protein PBI_MICHELLEMYBELL_56 [Mycobacterium phage MichelleMyBell]